MTVRNQKKGIRTIEELLRAYDLDNMITEAGGNITGDLTINFNELIDTSMIYQSLWSGSWSGGNITVPNTADYNVFLLKYYTNFYIVAVKIGTTIRGVGGYYHPTNGPMLGSVDISFIGETWTYTNLNRLYITPSSTNSAVTALTITEIFGWL